MLISFSVIFPYIIKIPLYVVYKCYHKKIHGHTELPKSEEGGTIFDGVCLELNERSSKSSILTMPSFIFPPVASTLVSALPTSKTLTAATPPELCTAEASLTASHGVFCFFVGTVILPVPFGLGRFRSRVGVGAVGAIGVFDWVWSWGRNRCTGGLGCIILVIG